MNKILRFSLVALMAIVFGNVYADEATIKYTGGTTTNMTGENDAALVGLDASAWSVVGDKGSHDQFPGLNKDGSIRLYWKEPTSNTITVSSLTGATINSIKFTFIEGYENVSVTVGGNLVSATDGTYAINSSSFILGNANTSSKQVRFTELVINYTPAGGGGGGGTTPEVWDASTADLEAIAANPVANDNDNFFVIPEETKLYPAGTYPNNSSIVVKSDGGVPAGLKNYILIGETASIKMTGTSTPNHDASANEGWQLKANGEANANAGLNTDDCTVKFQKAIAPKNGNPSMSYKYYYEDKEDHSGTSARVSEDYWTPELKQMPLKGLYYEFETKAAGELLIGIRMNREWDPLYIFTKDDFEQLPISALSLEGFVNNNTVVWGTNEKAMSVIPMTTYHNYDHGNGKKAEDYDMTNFIEGYPTSKAVFGYLRLNVAADKTYVMLSPTAQPAIFGFQFTPGGDPSGVETIKVEKAWNANAPMYNLSGQKVDKSYKGIVIQNGRKFVNK